jgi:hypothetical protein
MTSKEELITSFKTMLQEGFSIKKSFKVAPLQWMGEISLYGDELKGHGCCTVYGSIGLVDFHSMDEAIDYFCSLVYNIDNYHWLYELGESEKLIEDVEEIEYYDEQEMNELLAKYREIFPIKCPLAAEFNNKKAQETIRLMIADWHRSKQENEDEE